MKEKLEIAILFIIFIDLIIVNVFTIGCIIGGFLRGDFND